MTVSRQSEAGEVPVQITQTVPCSNVGRRDRMKWTDFLMVIGTFLAAAATGLAAWTTILAGKGQEKATLQSGLYSKQVETAALLFAELYIFANKANNTGEIALKSGQLDFDQSAFDLAGSEMKTELQTIINTASTMELISPRIFLKRIEFIKAYAINILQTFDFSGHHDTSTMRDAMDAMHSILEDLNTRSIKLESCFAIYFADGKLLPTDTNGISPPCVEEEGR